VNITLKRYWQTLVTYLQPLWPQALLLAVVLFGSIGLQLVNPQILRFFIDTATGGGPLSVLGQSALLFVGIALANQALSVLATYTSENLGWSATNALREDLALHCLRLDMSFHKGHTPGDMIERIDGDVTALANFFSQFVINIVGNAVLLVGVLVVLWLIDWRAGVAMLVFGSMTLGILIAMRSMAVPYWEGARQAAADFTGFLVERLGGTEDIRSSGAVPFVLRGFFKLMRQRLQKERQASLIAGSMSFMNLLLHAIGTAIAFILSALLYRSGEISLGTAFIILNYVEMIFRPLNIISQQMQNLQMASAGLDRVEKLFATTSCIQDGPGKALPGGQIAVEFRDVSFAYEGDDTVLHRISFRLQPGRVLGVLGRTGSGKTTITRLLARLYDPKEGAILLGGVDIRQVHLKELRRRVGVVTQDVQLFEATVRDNLTFFDTTISDDRIVRVLCELGLGQWYHSLPHGLDTELAADGGGLSAGEAQLLAFARVFLADPGLVIMDEASSRLDSATEALIERAIDKLLYNRTALIVAHRLATVHRADEIMIVENGCICEHGERARLAADPGSRFYGLLQTGLEEALK